MPDSKAKTLQIISAYKTKAEGVSQVLNMPESPQLTSETPHAFAPSDNNVAQTKSYVKSVPATVDGRSVTVSGIDRIETNGNRAQMYVKTADGESVALSDVKFGNRETEAIYNFAQGFESTNTARAFVTGYNQGDSANDYMNAFLDFRSAGMAGRDFDSVLQSTANKYGNLEMSQLRQAYYAGVNEENNAPKRYSKKTEERAEKKGGLLRNYKSKLTREQAGQVYVMEALAKKIESINEILKNLGLTNQEIKALEGDEEALETISGLLKSALEQTRENKAQGKTTDMADEKKKYSIGKTTKNKSVVVIADDILKGVDKSDWVAKVKDVIRTKFSDGIFVEGKLIKVNKITRNEYTNSKNTQHYQRKDAVIYKDKFKASSNLNEIVLASTNCVNKDLKHQRKDNFTEFARGDVLVRVGKNDCSAKVIVGFTSGKEMVLYDIVDFTPTKFELKNENAFTEQPLKVQLSRQHASSDTRVTQSEPSVNSSISEKAQNDAKKFSLKDTTNESDSQTKSEAFKEWFGDWENEPESASKVVNEDGTPKVVYHGTGNEFFCFRQKKQGENYRQGKGGFFFTSYKKTTENYAKLATDDGGTARVVEAYLSIRKPYTVYANAIYIIS